MPRSCRRFTSWKSHHKSAGVQRAYSDSRRLGGLAAATTDHRTHRLVGPEILGAIDIEQRRELRARPVDATLDGADRAAADRRGVFIGEARSADQDQRLALVLRQLVQRGAKFLELQM